MNHHAYTIWHELRRVMHVTVDACAHTCLSVLTPAFVCVLHWLDHLCLYYFKEALDSQVPQTNELLNPFEDIYYQPFGFAVQLLPFSKWRVCSNTHTVATAITSTAAGIKTCHNNWMLMIVSITTKQLCWAVCLLAAALHHASQDLMSVMSLHYTIWE